MNPAEAGRERRAEEGPDVLKRILGKLKDMLAERKGKPTVVEDILADDDTLETKTY